MTLVQSEYMVSFLVNCMSPLAYSLHKGWFSLPATDYMHTVTTAEFCLYEVNERIQLSLPCLNDGKSNNQPSVTN